MPKIMLTSNGLSTDDIAANFLSLFENDPVQMKACILTTASLQKEQNIYARKAKADLVNMGFATVDYLDIEFDEAKQLTNYHCIYINGGNPFYLLEHLKQSGADQVIRDLNDQQVLIGVSAGAMVLGNNIEIAEFFTPEMNARNLQDLSGLKLVNLSLFPHSNREDLFNDPHGQTIADRIDVFEQRYICEVTRLADNQFLIV